MVQSCLLLLFVWLCISGASNTGERSRNKHVKKRPSTAMELLSKAQAADRAGKKVSALKLYERSISSARSAGMDIETLVPMYRAAIVAARVIGENHKRRPLLYEFIDLIGASYSEALVQALSELSDLEEVAGNLVDAYKVIEKAVLLSPTTHALQNSAGSLMLRLSRPQMAIHHFEAALSSSEAEATASPLHGDLYAFNLGLARSRIHDHAGAYDAFAKANYYRQPRRFPEADYRMGLCLDYLGRYHDAAQLFESVIAQYENVSDSNMFRISGGLSQVRWDLHNAYLSRFRYLDGLNQLKIVLDEEKYRSPRHIYGALHLSRYISTWSHVEGLTNKALTTLHGEIEACSHDVCQSELTPMRALAWAPAPILSQVLKVWQNNVMRFQSNVALDRQANASAELWGRHCCGNNRRKNTQDNLEDSGLNQKKKRKRKRRILNIGYVSADWETFHPMSPILKGLLHSQRVWRGEGGGQGSTK
jgi:tetratricopeptide (TPR) repeat protein